MFDTSSFTFGLQVCMIAWIGSDWLDNRDRSQVRAWIFWITTACVALRVIGLAL